jgi:hypothetical protein
VLALLAASYGRPASDVVATIVTRSENPKPRKASKLAAVKAAKVEAAEAATHLVTPETQKPVTVIELPAVGTLDARAFLVAMRRATNRDECIKAIAGYCGYDRLGDHGAQDLAARMKAQRELRGAPKALAAPVHTGQVSLKGYVHGMPDGVAVKMGDLLGRERLSAETLADHERIAGDNEVAPSLRHYHAQLAIVETARLAEIRADLAALALSVTG